MDNEEIKRCQKLKTLQTLHQTILSLRLALDASQCQLQLLKSKLKNKEDIEAKKELQNLLIENHILKTKFLKINLPELNDINFQSMAQLNLNHKEDGKSKELTELEKNESANKNQHKEIPLRSISCDYPETKDKFAINVRSFSEDANITVKEPNQSSTSKEKINGDSDNESEELNDIELIFTTEETKELGVLQEDLVSISEGEPWQPNSDQVVLKFTEENELKKPSDLNLNKVSTHSVLVETDISKCGVIENENPENIVQKTTLPKSLLYNQSKGANKIPVSSSLKRVLKFSTNVFQTHKNYDSVKSSVRPILIQRNSYKKESEAQTDITALPAHWRSESYLAHKVSYNFTTLPSKFTLPINQTSQNKYALRLSDKTQEARRTLLSDINFTSMVPELSRSADHLCQKTINNNGNSESFEDQNKHSYLKNVEMQENLISPNFKKTKESLLSCDCRKSMWDQNHHLYRGSLSSLRSTNSDFNEHKKRHFWKTSPEMSRSVSMITPSTWRSVPSSPICNHRSKDVLYFPCNWTNITESNQNLPSYGPKNKFKAKYKVTFQDSGLEKPAHPGMSCPDLRIEHDSDSGDSTDSLIDEAEEYLRRSIDSILTGEDCSKILKKRHPRRYSEPDLIRNSGPPFNAEPFLPKRSDDLKLNYFVKVITIDGRVVVGRVRFIGYTQNEIDTQIGIELSQPFGDSDGTFLGKRYFRCNPDHAMFVPFKKVIMAWSY